jgi:hypothetical protein
MVTLQERAVAETAIQAATARRREATVRRAAVTAWHAAATTRRVEVTARLATETQLQMLLDKIIIKY